ncbi:hypothetical protein L209DRAFT_83520 [Thermothelomyces heterothallicus CBS 203.75]
MSVPIGKTPVTTWGKRRLREKHGSQLCRNGSSHNLRLTCPLVSSGGLRCPKRREAPLRIDCCPAIGWTTQSECLSFHDAEASRSTTRVACKVNGRRNFQEQTKGPSCRRPSQALPSYPPPSCMLLEPAWWIEPRGFEPVRSACRRLISARSSRLRPSVCACI